MAQTGRTRHPLHSICSYLGCFPPRVPQRIIDRWVQPGALVLDPFCGSGTTLVEALLSGRHAIGIDLNPLAVAICEAKLQRVDLRDVVYRVTELSARFNGVQPLDEVPDALRIIYHPRTLMQLCYLRRALQDKSPEDLFIRGALLGIMHGKMRKGGGSAYLSIDMPNTFSMSPDYVLKFVRRHRLRQRPFDVFSKVGERCSWLLRRGAIASQDRRAIVVHGDATKLDDVLRPWRVDAVDAIVASPPYLGVLRYGAFNWIRLWFLGYEEPGVIDRALDGTDSLDGYLSFMAAFLRSASDIVRVGGTVALVVGDVRENGQHLRLAHRVWEEVQGLAPFELAFLGRDCFDEGAKTTRIWGEGKKGRATPLDRVLVLRRVRRLPMSRRVEGKRRARGTWPQRGRQGGDRVRNRRDRG